MNRPRTLLSTTIAILACACAGAVLDAAAAQPAAAGVTAHASRAPRSGARRRQSQLRACRASHRGRGIGRTHGRKANTTCRSQAVRSAGSHARRSGTGNSSKARLGGAHAAHERSGGRRRERASTAPAAPADPSIASVLATPCENTELTPEPGNLAEIETATLCLVNQERARNDELPLALNAQLQQAAQGHSEEMVSDDYFAHTSPSGLTPLERVQATGYIPNSQVGYTIGENIAWGTLQLSTPSSIVAAWIASPEHLANILYAPYRDTGVGVVAAVPASLGEGQPGAIYAQEFGVIDE